MGVAEFLQCAGKHLNSEQKAKIEREAAKGFLRPQDVRDLLDIFGMLAEASGDVMKCAEKHL